MLPRIIVKTSHRGLVAIEAREGVRLSAYRDSKGLPTIGVGHLIVPGDGFNMKSRITQEQCDELFAQDVQKYENAVNKCVKVPLEQNQFDALVSFCLNIGTGDLKTGKGGFAGSSVVRCLNARDYNGAAQAFMKWVKPPEIKGRRRSEQKQFLTPYPKNSAAAVDLATGKPAVEQPPTPPEQANQTIVSVPPVQTEPPDPGIIGKIQTWYAAAPAFALSALGAIWSWLQGAAVEIIVAFLIATGIVAIVFIILNYRGRQNEKQRLFDAEQRQKDRDFELTKIQLESAANPMKQTVRLQPPPAVIPNNDAPAEEKV
jgi:GH24 family phage-related lysozyme (muramidase)